MTSRHTFARVLSVARLAQLVEHPLDVGRVTGSSPVSRTMEHIPRSKSPEPEDIAKETAQRSEATSVFSAMQADPGMASLVAEKVVLKKGNQLSIPVKVGEYTITMEALITKPIGTEAPFHLLSLAVDIDKEKPYEAQNLPLAKQIARRIYTLWDFAGKPSYTPTVTPAGPDFTTEAE